jgi:hypothetical protein
VESRLLRALPVATLALAALLLHQGVLFSGQAYFDRDVEHFLYERLIAFRSAILDGAWPVWNPYPAFGEPMLAIANAQFAYPTTWLALLFSPETTQALIVTLHTLLAGLGAYALGRELGLSRSAALMAGLLWSLGGPIRSSLNQANVLVGASWIAWAWLGFARAGRSGSRSDALIAGGAIAACLLGGSPESALMAVAGAWLAFAPAETLATPAASTRALGAATIASLAGLGLAAIQWVPTAALVGRSIRATMQGNPVLQGFWSNPPALLAQLVLPLPLDGLPLTGAVREQLFFGREPLLLSIYGGLAAAGFALVGSLCGRNRGRLGLVLLTALALALSLGRFSPLWDVVSRLPILALIRFPARFAIVAGLALAMLAGMGLDALRSREAPPARLAAGALGAATLAAIAWSLSGPGSALWHEILQGPAALGRAWAETGPVLAMFTSLKVAALAVAPLVLAVALRVSRGRQGVVAALAIIAAFAAVGELAFSLHSLVPTLPRDVLALAPATLAPIPRTRPNRTFAIEYSSRFAAVALGREIALPRFYDEAPAQTLRTLRQYPSGSLGRFGGTIESIPVDTPLLRGVMVSRWVRLMHALAPTAAFPRILELSGVAFLVSLHDPGAPELELVGRAPGLLEDVLTFRVRKALPRAYAVSGVRVAADEASVAALMDAGFDPAGEIVLSDGAPRPAGRAGRVRIEHLGFDRVTLDAELESPGHVVLLESWDPGWTASVDGVPAPVRRANLIFRAVPVPVGRHRVEMRYRPVEVGVGAALSLISVLVCGLAWTRGVTRG